MDRQNRIRAVLDTSVLLGIHRHALLRLAAIGIYTIVCGDYIFAELQRKLVEMGWQTHKANELLFLLEKLAVKVDDSEITGGNYDEWLHDVNDHPVMATAIAGRVDYLVTSNTRDFPPKMRFAGITILTSDAFLRLFD